MPTATSGDEPVPRAPQPLRASCGSPSHPALASLEYRAPSHRFAQNCSVFPARLEVDVEIGGPAHGRGGAGNGAFLQQLARDREEAVDPVLRLDVALDLV